MNIQLSAKLVNPPYSLQTNCGRLASIHCMYQQILLFHHGIDVVTGYKSYVQWDLSLRDTLGPQFFLLQRLNFLNSEVI